MDNVEAVETVETVETEETEGFVLRQGPNGNLLYNGNLSMAATATGIKDVTIQGYSHCPDCMPYGEVRESLHDFYAFHDLTPKVTGGWSTKTQVWFRHELSISMDEFKALVTDKTDEPNELLKED